MIKKVIIIIIILFIIIFIFSFLSALASLSFFIYNTYKLNNKLNQFETNLYGNQYHNPFLKYCTFDYDNLSPILFINKENIYKYSQQFLQDIIYKYNDTNDSNLNGQFSINRYVIMIEPGNYIDWDISVGYYMQIIGLGNNPNKVNFTSTGNKLKINKNIYCQDNSFDTFWRNVENLSINSSYIWPGLNDSGFLWSVSQGSSLRRIKTDKLYLYQMTEENQNKYQRGGYISSSKITENINYGSQMQFLTKSSSINEIINYPLLNSVFISINYIPNNKLSYLNSPIPISTSTPTHNPNFINNLSNIQQTLTGGNLIYLNKAGDNLLNSRKLDYKNYYQVISEKPFIFIEDREWKLCIPELKNIKEQGIELDWNLDNNSTILDFNYDIQIVDPDFDAEEINYFISLGKSIIFIPGIYLLDSPLIINNDNNNKYIILFGLGLATLVPLSNNPVIIIKDNSKNIRICGLIIEAGQNLTKTLIQIGENIADDNDNTLFDFPCFLHDITIRVGGANQNLYDNNLSSQRKASTLCMITINANYVICDNIWLLRTEYDYIGEVNSATDYYCENALIVNGNYVNIFGLTAEHTLEDIVIWNGEFGLTCSCKIELPINIPAVYNNNYNEILWDFTGYKVNSNVKNHYSYGLGIFHQFKNSIKLQDIIISTICDSAIIAPDHLIANFIGSYVFNAHIQNNNYSVIKNIINKIKIKNINDKINYFYNNIDKINVSIESKEKNKTKESKENNIKYNKPENFDKYWCNCEIF